MWHQRETTVDVITVRTVHFIFMAIFKRHKSPRLYLF